MKPANQFARIIGTGSYLPSKIVTNHDLEKMIDTSDEWITTRTGIKQRHIVTDESACDLAEMAANNALDMAGIKASELDLIILATTTPDKIFPATATILQHRIGAFCPAFDIQAVCAGFIFALTTAQQYIETGTFSKILVVGSETMSRIVNWQDRSTSTLFGDGAGAVVLTSSKEMGIIRSEILSDGKYTLALHTNNKYINETGYIEMVGSEVFKIAVNKLASVTESILKKSNIGINEIDWMIPHQANIRIIATVAKRIKIPMEKIIVTIDKHGNTSAASIPLAFDQAVRDKRIKKDDIILLEGIGGGFSWGGVLLKF